MDNASTLRANSKAATGLLELASLSPCARAHLRPAVPRVDSNMLLVEYIVEVDSLDRYPAVRPLPLASISLAISSNPRIYAYYQPN
jgi:endonuclease/exonuclease/phosphatase (EEP) superfamily protein YafD